MTSFPDPRYLCIADLQETLVRKIGDIVNIDTSLISSIKNERSKLIPSSCKVVSNRILRQAFQTRKFSILELLNEALQFLGNQLILMDELAKSNGLPILGANFENLTPNDLSNLEKLFRPDVDKVEDEFRLPPVPGLSAYRSSLLKQIDAALEEVCRYHFFWRSITSNHFDRRSCRIPSSTRARNCFWRTMNRKAKSVDSQM